MKVRSTKRFAWSAQALPRAAPCCGKAIRPMEPPGLSKVTRNTPSPFPRAKTIFGTEPPSNSSSITAHTTADTGKWTFTSGNLSRCQNHIWYRAPFQFKLNNGSYYSGYWEMDIHFRKSIEMPEPYVVKFWDETSRSDAFGWDFYER